MAEHQGSGYVERVLRTVTDVQIVEEGVGDEGRRLFTEDEVTAAFLAIGGTKAKGAALIEALRDGFQRIKAPASGE